MSREVHPWGALLSPLWLAALLALALNDHILKYSGCAGVVTGKLSDFAGMIVAPALLACVLVVRTRAGLLACHVAVAVVFGSLKVSAAAAGWWPWRVVVDPTDLLALPALWASWRWLAPAMRERSPAARRGLTAAAASVGLLVCTATSPRRDYPPGPPTPMAAPSDQGVVVVLRTRVEGTLELRCDDGRRGSVVMRGDSQVVVGPLPAEGVECKLQVLGVAGSHGPVTLATRVLQCEVRPDSLRCVRAEAGY